MMFDDNQLGQFLSNSFGDIYLYEVNRNAFNQVGSEALYKNHFGEDLFQPSRLYIVCGADSGVLLTYLKKRPLPDGSRYLFVELPSVLERLQQEGLLTDLPERLAVVSPEAFWAKAEAFQFEDYAYLENVMFFEALCSVDGHLPEYRDLSFKTRENVLRTAWGIVASVGNTHFVERQLKNLCEAGVDAGCLRDLFRGKTAVVLGGGPSLDDILPWVRDHQDEVVILAVSRICRQLSALGLAPHFIFSADPGDHSFDVSKEMLHFSDRSIFVWAYHVSPLLPAQWSGRSLYLGPRFPWQTALNPDNIDVAGPTVTNIAVWAAVQMGVSQVILGGVDFCFRRDGISHASGSNESAAGPRLGDTYGVETNGGWQADTSADFACSIDAMGEQALYAREHGCQIINPASGAAVIPHVVHLPLSEIVVESLERSPVMQVCESLPADSGRLRGEHYRRVLVELENAKLQLVKVRQLAEEALECNDGLFGRNGKQADFKYKIRMDEIEEQLSAEFADFYPLVKQYGIRRFLKIIRPDSLQEWSDEEIERVGRVYYESCRDSAEKLLGVLEEACCRARVRLEEEQADPDFDRLVEWWRSEGQLGRASVWKTQHPERLASLAPEVEIALEALDREFTAVMAEKETVHLKKVREYRTLSGVKGRALRLFRAGDRAGLLRMKEGLSLHPDRAGAGPLEFFVSGLLAELEGTSEQALACYQQLIGDTFDSLTEDALKRILVVSIATKNMDFALTALECLSRASDFYKPQFAELLRLSGRVNEALDVYADYLEKVPSDLPVMLKLGRFYMQLGSEEGARLMFDAVLNRDPSNQAAKSLLAQLQGAQRG